MNIFAISGLINSISVFILGSAVYFKNRKKEINIRYALFCFFCGLWSICYFFWQVSQDRNSALFWSRSLMAGAIFIPICFLHFVLLLLGLYEKRKKIVAVGYWIFLLFFALNFTPWFVSDVKPKMFFKFWPEPGPIFAIFLLVWFWYCLYPCYLLIRDYRKFTGLKHQQIKYVLIGILIGYSSGSTNYFLWYDIPIPPYGSFIVPLFVGMMAYAIVRHRLMDINVALTRATVFILVYTPVLALPFIIGTFSRPFLQHLLGNRWWIGPPVVSTILATVGPFIYLFLQRRAENRLLREQRRYQDTLSHASRGMTRIRELNKLLSLIVHIITKTVRITSACVYLFNERTNQFELMAVRDRDENFPTTISYDEALIQHIISKREAIVYEELRQKIQEQSSGTVQEIDGRLKAMHSALIVPSFVEDKLIGFISLGSKLSGQMYTQDDLVTFTVLMNQAGIAIDNALAYQELRATQHKLIQAEKLAAIGSFSSGIIHEIKNPLTAIKTFSEFLEEKYDDPEFRSKFSRIVKSETERINDIVQQLLDYAKPVEPKFEDTDIMQVIEETLNLIEADLAKKRIRVEKNFHAEQISLRLDPNQMKQVFLNLFNNAVEAMAEQGVLTVTINKPPDSKYLTVEVIDTGSGIAEEDLPHIFKPFYTTKSRNIGLGLSIVNAIIKAHQGEIKVESRVGQGTKFILKFAITT